MKEIYKIYASTFFVGLSTSVAVISTLFYLTNGLSQTEIATLLSTFMLTYALLEIPTGGIADTFGHKTSIFLGIICMAVSFLVTALSSNFYMFLTAMLFAALGFALNSGAYSALIQDILNKLGKGEEFTKIYGRMGSALLIGPLVAAPFMSLLFTYNIRFPYLLGFLFLIIAAILISGVRWEFKNHESSFSSYFRKTKNGVMAVLKSKPMIGLVIVSIGLGFSRSLFNQNINQPFLVDIGINIALIGTIAAVISGSEALTSAFSHRMLKKIGVQFSLLFIVITPALLLITLSKIHTIIGLLPILIFALAHTYRENVIMTLYQKEASNMERATMVSTTSFLTYIVVGLMLPIGGFGIDSFGMRNILIASGITAIVLGLIGTFIYIRSRWKIII